MSNLISQPLPSKTRPGLGLAPVVRLLPTSGRDLQLFDAQRQASGNVQANPMHPTRFRVNQLRGGERKKKEEKSKHQTHHSEKFSISISKPIRQNSKNRIFFCTPKFINNSITYMFSFTILYQWQETYRRNPITKFTPLIFNEWKQFTAWFDTYEEPYLSKSSVISYVC